MWKKVMATDDSWSLFVPRLALGAVIFTHGAQKGFGWFGGSGLEGALGFFGSLGIPATLGVLIIALELGSAVALVIGVAGRLAAAAVVGVMLGAITLVHAPYGFFMNWYGNQSGEGFEFHILAIALAVAIMIRGSGAVSIDRRFTTVN